MSASKRKAKRAAEAAKAARKPVNLDPDWVQVQEARKTFWYGEVLRTKPDGTEEWEKCRMLLGYRVEMADGSYWFQHRSGSWTQHNRLPVPVMAYGQHQTDRDGRLLWQGAIVTKYPSTMALIKALYDRPVDQRVVWCRLISALMQGVELAKADD